MSHIALHWGPLGYAVIALIIGSPGLAFGAVAGAILWRRHPLSGAIVGALIGLTLWIAGFIFWKMSP